MMVYVPLWMIVLFTTLAACFGILIGWGFTWAAQNCGPDKYTGIHEKGGNDA